MSLIQSRDWSSAILVPYEAGPVSLSGIALNAVGNGNRLGATTGRPSIALVSCMMSSESYPSPTLNIFPTVVTPFVTLGKTSDQTTKYTVDAIPARDDELTTIRFAHPATPAQVSMEGRYTVKLQRTGRVLTSTQMNKIELATRADWGSYRKLEENRRVYGLFGSPVVFLAVLGGYLCTSTARVKQHHSSASNSLSRAFPPVACIRKMPDRLTRVLRSDRFRVS
ncbi:hypothetical protein NEOLEDRAFT_1149199 [Neolentinus lepideus HHB14362 ss-1]|uniref:Uncharacterized protein n=1 Tax=Neolentinus lepideus HHB14362 ss-1 TaxID=1314782 RepID=A0A165RE56_9AGAM|nr:hypothetical protein NEOLEDRAFT_1149199 [Neolentinus lepideus HHB14362 ss-1]